MALRWNGSEWSSSAVPNPKGSAWAELFGVSCVSAEECIAVGNYGMPTTELSGPLAERWNGHEWKLQEVVNPHGEAEELAAAGELTAASCSSAGHCTAVGQSGTTGWQLVERYE
jgi:hypothetical protein